MKVLTLNKRRILKLFMVVVFILIVGSVSTSFGMQHYYDVDFSTGLVTSNLNLRSGPGTKYKL